MKQATFIFTLIYHFLQNDTTSGPPEMQDETDSNHAVSLQDSDDDHDINVSDRDHLEEICAEWHEDQQYPYLVGLDDNDNDARAPTEQEQPIVGEPHTDTPTEQEQAQLIGYEQDTPIDHDYGRQDNSCSHGGACLVPETDNDDSWNYVPSMVFRHRGRGPNSTDVGWERTVNNAPETPGMLPVERALSELRGLSHDVKAICFITSKAFTGPSTKFYSERVMVPGLYDVLLPHGEHVRMLMQPHPSNVLWADLPRSQVPYDCVNDAFDVLQLVTTTNPHAVAGVGSIQNDLPAGKYRLIRRGSDDSWAWLTVRM